jgi:hypothetical protein
METHLTPVLALDELLKGSTQEAQPTQRILLYADELYRVPLHCRRLHIIHGTAYLSQDGQDFVLRPGEFICFAQTKGVVLVSPLRSPTLVIELFD